MVSFRRARCIEVAADAHDVPPSSFTALRTPLSSAHADLEKPSVDLATGPVLGQGGGQQSDVDEGVTARQGRVCGPARLMRAPCTTSTTTPAETGFPAPPRASALGDGGLGIRELRGQAESVLAEHPAKVTVQEARNAAPRNSFWVHRRFVAMATSGSWHLPRRRAVGLSAMSHVTRGRDRRSRLASPVGVTSLAFGGCLSAPS
jgi:hypothetical protein